LILLFSLRSESSTQFILTNKNDLSGEKGLDVRLIGSGLLSLGNLKLKGLALDGLGSSLWLGLGCLVSGFLTE